MLDPFVIQELAKPMEATLIVAGMAIGVNLLFSLGRRFLTDVGRERRIRAEVMAFQKELREAVLSRNKAKEEKLRRKEKQMREMQMKLSMSTLRVTFLFFIPLLLLWQVLLWIIGDAAIVAVSPIPFYLGFINIEPQLNFFWWYMISSFAFSGIITKLLGVGLD